MKQYRLMFFFVFIAPLICSITAANEPSNRKTAPPENQFLEGITTIGDYVEFDVNNISTYIRNNGSFNRNPGTGNSGFEWPKGSGKTAIYASGLWMGGKSNDTIRVAVAEYSYEYEAGPIAPGVDPTDPQWRVYKIRRGDNAVNNPDYADWPFDDGAPALKNYLGTADSLDGDGKRIPELLGDMTAWAVFNENNPAVHTNMGSPPLGIEVQLTAYGYDNAGVLGNTIFYKWKLINKGGRQIDSMYISIWADVDVGGGANDYDGCDTLLGLGYTYSADSINAQYGACPPATGFVFLQGPIVPGNPTDTIKLPDGRIFPGKKMLKMTSYIRYDNDNTIDLGNPYTAEEVYNYFQAITRSGLPIKGPDSLKAMFMYTGDPNDPFSTTNWIETGTSGDRRFLMSSGPFTMQPGDTQEVISANLIAQGTSNTNSVTVLKEATETVLSLFDVNSPPLPTMTVEVTYPSSTEAKIWTQVDAHTSSITAMTATLKRPDDSTLAIVTLYDDGAHNDNLPNDGIFGNSILIIRESQGLYWNLELQDSYGRIYTLGHFYDNITTVGPLDLLGNPIVLSDNLNNDFHVNPGENIRYGFSIQNNTKENLAHLSIIPENLYSTSNIENVNILKDSIFSIHPNSYFDFQLSSDYADTVYQMPMVIRDHNFNRWDYILTFNVYPLPQPIYGVPFIHSAGISDWDFSATVVDPSIIKNHTYELSFTITPVGNRTMALQDLNTSTFLFTDLELPDSLGHSLPYTDGFKIMGGPNYGIAGLNYSLSCEWLSTFPPWFHGYFLGPYAIAGADLWKYIAYVYPEINPLNYVPVEIRFDAANPQKAYRLSRITGPPAGYLIQSFDNVPFSAWDISDSLHPRQMTIAWRDYDNDGTWNLSTDYEYTFIYNKTYDPTGTTQFTMPPNAIIGECTIGEKADIMYGFVLSLLPGHTLNESTGKMYLRPYLAPDTSDRYTFNPVITSVEAKDFIPKKFSLFQNYPNPFNPSTTIQFTIPTKQMVKLKVYNLLGQEVAVLVNGLMEAGNHQFEWNGRNSRNIMMASGVYFYRLEAGKFIDVKKMLLLK